MVRIYARRYLSNLYRMVPAPPGGSHADDGQRGTLTRLCLIRLRNCSLSAYCLTQAGSSPWEPPPNECKFNTQICIDYLEHIRLE